VQGKQGDWHIEASDMASIYGGAFLTVAFVDGSSFETAAKASGGVFVSGLDTDAFWNGQRLPFRPEYPESVYRWLDRTGNFPSRPEGNLDTRGWTFQERLLSLRLLSVTREGLFWDCLRLSASDWRPLRFRGDFSPKFRDTDERKAKRFLFNRTRAIPWKSGGSPSGLTTWLTQSGERAEQYRLWRLLVQNYTTRAFTDQGDRVIAIEGVIRFFGMALDDKYELGVWMGDALRSLIWFVEPNDTKEVTHPDMPPIIAPSWSWTSVSGPIQYRLWHPFSRRTDGAERVEPCVTFGHIAVF
jgi:hypothetical protein